MPTRRAFLTGLTATAVIPRPGWSSVGSPEFLAAALFPGEEHRLAGLNADGTVLFTVPLPDRGHAAAAHPTKAQAIAFARRPGTFALVINCAKGMVEKQLQAPQGRHFYGHGAFSADGSRFFTTENDFEAGEGVIGIWDAESYARLGEFPSGGIGPHDILLMPDGMTLVVANGGIETHPDSGRTKLNLPTMRSNLSYLNLSGHILEQVQLAPDLHKNSIRHLAVRQDGLVGFALQWQGNQTAHPPLVGLHTQGARAKLISAPDHLQRGLQGYAGSIAFSARGDVVAITCPRGNALHRFDILTAAFKDAFTLEDVCGLGTGAQGLAFTTGTGAIGTLSDRPRLAARAKCQWDNHLVSIRP